MVAPSTTFGHDCLVPSMLLLLLLWRSLRRLGLWVQVFPARRDVATLGTGILVAGHLTHLDQTAVQTGKVVFVHTTFLFQ